MIEWRPVFAAVPNDANWPEGEVAEVRREIGFRDETGLIVLTLSFVVRDPERT